MSWAIGLMWLMGGMIVAAGLACWYEAWKSAREHNRTFNLNPMFHRDWK